MKTYRIHLIRHGLTAANLDGRYAGVTDIPVTEEGIRELRACRDTLQYPDATRFYTSPLTRCRQTLDVLYDEPDYIVVPDLREWDFGRFENKTPRELRGDRDFQNWMTDSVRYQPPGGERGEDFLSRVIRGFQDVVYDVMRSGERDSVICTHGGVIMALLSSCGVPERHYRDWICGNGRGYTVRVTPSVFMRTSKVEIVDTVPAGDDAGQMQGAQRALFESFRD